MITNLSIGNCGRLGNQMFQYALLIGIKYSKEFNIILDENITSTELFNCFDLKQCVIDNRLNIEGQIKHQYIESLYPFDPTLFDTIQNYTNFFGFFQSEKYFKKYKDLIYKEFSFRLPIVDMANQFLEQFSGKRLVSVHIRRGDYLQSPSNGLVVLPTSYYENAVNLFGKDVQYIGFSDDVDWCENNLDIQNIVYSKNSTGLDLCIMSLCHDNIIANSSYSWWGAWLNKTRDKRVIAPKKWLGPDNTNDVSALYCDDWTVI